MTVHLALTKAGHQYATAYSTHYTTQDLPRALELYRGVMIAHPGASEAGYSRAQIANIVKAVVPKQELLDANVVLALELLRRREKPEATPTPGMRLAEKSPD